jgi:LuxR family transcriptional regulator, maltose regulon positive regulatory protein
VSRMKSSPGGTAAHAAPRPTKLTPPDAAGLIARQRLHDLADTRRGGVVWVSSPAGGGKSSFVATWCHALGDARVVWFHVDAGDSDPASLFAWLARTVDDPAAAAGLPQWSVEQGLDPVRFGQRFFRAYADALCAGDNNGRGGDAVLIFDNVHDAASSPIFCSLLHELVKAKSASTTVVLTSRHVPDDALLPITAHPRFASIGWPELRCTDDEARGMAVVWGLAAPKPHVLALAGGWVSALVIMLRYPHVVPDAGSAALPDPARVFDAIAGGTFKNLPNAHRSVLLLGAFMPRFNVQALAAALGPDGIHVDIGDTLDDIWRRHFFLERRTDDAGRSDYVGHPMLLAFLREHARAAWSERELVHRVGVGAQHLAEAGDAEAAALTYEAVGAWRDVAMLVEARFPQWLQQGRMATIAEWLRKFAAVSPQQPLDDVRPALERWQGILLALQRDVAAFDWLERSHRGHLERGQYVEALLAVVARMEAYFLLWEQWPESGTWADELARLFDLVEDQLPRPLLIRVLTSCASMMFPCFEHPLLARFARLALEIVKHSGDPNEQLALSAFLIGYSSWMGKVAVVREVSIIAAAAMDKAHAAPTVAIQSALAIAMAAYSDGRAADPSVHGFLERAFELVERHDLQVWEFQCWLTRCAERLFADDPAGVEQALARCRALCNGRRSAGLLLLMRELMVLNGSGEWRKAAEKAQSALEESPDLAGYVFGKQYIALQLAMAGTMIGMPKARIEELVQEPMAMARRQGNHYLDITGSFVLAALHHREGDPQIGDQHLRRAVSTACVASHRHLHPTRAASIPFFRPLLARALEIGIETEWLSALICQQRVPAPEGTIGWPHRIRIRVLGGFDVTVNGHSIVQAGKGKQPTRVFEMLSHLALHGHDAVGSAAVADALWPDAAGDSGALEITLHRARKLLDDPTAIVQAHGTLHLNADVVGIDLVDVCTWLRRCEEDLPVMAGEGPRLLRWGRELLACHGGWPRGFGERAPRSTRLSTRLERDQPRALRAYCDELKRMGMAAECRHLVRTLIDLDSRFAVQLGA